MNIAIFILFVLLLAAFFTAAVIYLGPVGYLPVIPVFLAFFFVVYKYDSAKTQKLWRSMEPSSPLIAMGTVSRGWFYTIAALVGGETGAFRLLISDRSRRLTVRAVASSPVRLRNPYDQQAYLQMRTDEGIVHFAPRKSFFVFSQTQYANQVLSEILGGGLAAIDPDQTAAAPLGK